LLLLLGLIEAINAAFTDASLHLLFRRHQINQSLWNAGAATPARRIGMGSASIFFAAERAGIFVDCGHGISDG